MLNNILAAVNALAANRPATRGSATRDLAQGYDAMARSGGSSSANAMLQRALENAIRQQLAGQLRGGDAGGTSSLPPDSTMPPDRGGRGGGDSPAGPGRRGPFVRSGPSDDPFLTGTGQFTPAPFGRGGKDGPSDPDMTGILVPGQDDVTMRTPDMTPQPIPKWRVNPQTGEWEEDRS